MYELLLQKVNATKLLFLMIVAQVSIWKQEVSGRVSAMQRLVAVAATQSGQDSSTQIQVDRLMNLLCIQHPYKVGYLIQKMAKATPSLVTFMDRLN